MRALAVAAALMAVGATRAQSLAEAKAAYAEGLYGEALPALRAAADKEPRNASVNHMAGVAMLREGMPHEAEPYLRRGGNDARVELAELRFLRYDFDGADATLDEYEKGLGKGRRAKEPRPEAAQLRDRIELGRTMMERVEKIRVVDSVNVDREDFFRAYRLSSSAGSLHGSEILPAGMTAAEPTAVYATENGRRLLWAAPDADENFRLMQTCLLDDGTWEAARPLGDNLAEGGDANFPFLMPDGVTLYYANDGANSLGGYDIFISRSDGAQGFLQPQNVGMPYNSPYDDYLLAIDEATGAGWWATDRNRLDGRITIYRFVPSELRINYPPDTPGLPGLARIASVSATHDPDTDYAALAARLDEAAAPRPAAPGCEFRLALPDGRVLTRMSQVPVSARAAVERWAERQRHADSLATHLEALRRAYAAGRVDASEITRCEADLEQARSRAATLASEAVGQM